MIRPSRAMALHEEPSSTKFFVMRIILKGFAAGREITLIPGMQALQEEALNCSYSLFPRNLLCLPVYAVCLLVLLFSCPLIPPPHPFVCLFRLSFSVSACLRPSVCLSPCVSLSVCLHTYAYALWSLHLSFSVLQAILLTSTFCQCGNGTCFKVCSKGQHTLYRIAFATFCLISMCAFWSLIFTRAAIQQLKIRIVEGFRKILVQNSI